MAHPTVFAVDDLELISEFPAGPAYYYVGYIIQADGGHKKIVSFPKDGVTYLLVNREKITSLTPVEAALMGKAEEEEVKKALGENDNLPGDPWGESAS